MSHCDICAIAVKYDKSCTCIFNHTYKQIRKLWENDKHGQHFNGIVKSRPKFDDDVDRSTSSSSSSSGE